MEVKIGSTIIRLVLGDITQENTDIIVNAANTSLRGGGGVDGAIHRAGGSEILQECVEKYPEGCETGEARITTAGQLNAKFVIHTPGPIWKGGRQNEDDLLASCYRNSLHLAIEYDAKTIAFPSISTGVYRFPIDRASKIALLTVIENLVSTSIIEVHFVLFSDSDLQIYEKNLLEIINNR
ncbi:MAG: O-acetyl-ADP-ribose deacetylase [Promethearchaeota archaeon]